MAIYLSNITKLKNVPCSSSEYRGWLFTSPCFPWPADPWPHHMPLQCDSVPTGGESGTNDVKLRGESGRDEDEPWSFNSQVVPSFVLLDVIEDKKEKFLILSFIVGDHSSNEGLYPDGGLLGGEADEYKDGLIDLFEYIESESGEVLLPGLLVSDQVGDWEAYEDVGLRGLYGPECAGEWYGYW